MELCRRKSHVSIPLVEDVLLPETSRIRDQRRRITDRLKAVNDITVLQRVLSRMEKILNEGVADQLEKKKTVKSTIEEKIMEEVTYLVHRP